MRQAENEALTVKPERFILGINNFSLAVEERQLYY